MRRAASSVRVLVAVLAVGLGVGCVRVYDGVAARNVAYRFLKNFHKTSDENSGTRLALERYVAAKRVAVLQQRDTFALWDYFDLRGKLAEHAGHEPRTWAEMVILRLELFAAKLAASGDTRYFLEKDKCTTLKTLKRLGLPHPAVRFRWSAAKYSELKLREALLSTTYPAILKVGHIHQQKSTLFLPDAEAVRARVDDFVAWTTAKMATKFADGSAVWSHVTNPLYEAIEPCLILQDVFNPGAFFYQATTDAPRTEAEANALRPVEVMVEMIWGVPMQGVLVVDVEGAMLLGEQQHLDTIEYLLRTDGWAAYKWPKLKRDTDGFWSKWNLNPHSAIRAHRKHQETWFRTLDPRDDASPDGTSAGIDESCRGLGSAVERFFCAREYRQEQARFWAKYGALTARLPTVWGTCASLAQGVGADYIRCDVFIDTATGKVDINEFSLSSYWGNTLSIDWQESVVDLWKGGYRRGHSQCQPEATCGDAFAQVFDGELPSPTFKRPAH